MMLRALLSPIMFIQIGVGSARDGGSGRRGRARVGSEQTRG